MTDRRQAAHTGHYAQKKRRRERLFDSKTAARPPVLEGGAAVWERGAMGARRTGDSTRQPLPA
jgi:hypothetical protein